MHSSLLRGAQSPASLPATANATNHRNFSTNATKGHSINHRAEHDWTCPRFSPTDYHIRFANVPKGSRASGHFEIINLSGTLSTNGSHLHISVSDGMGRMIGGHLLDECIVYTTAEIVIQSAPNLRFARENDGTTEWKDLKIEEK